MPTGPVEQGAANGMLHTKLFTSAHVSFEMLLHYYSDMQHGNVHVPSLLLQGNPTCSHEVCQQLLVSTLNIIICSCCKCLYCLQGGATTMTTEL